MILSAHFDSWDGGTGATDNGTGTLTMMEAMRILKKIYPNPKRTIIVGHWGSEEEGLNGSRAFVEDHPEIVKNIQAVFNQDNGTGRVVGNLSWPGLPLQIRTNTLTGGYQKFLPISKIRSKATFRAHLAGAGRTLHRSWQQEHPRSR